MARLIDDGESVKIDNDEFMIGDSFILRKEFIEKNSNMWVLDNKEQKIKEISVTNNHKVWLYSGLKQLDTDGNLRLYFAPGDVTLVTRNGWDI